MSTQPHVDASGVIDRPGFAAFVAREDLEPYGSNALLLFVAQLKLRLDDVESFAANALTDKANDKKIDLVALSPDRHQIIVAQGYFSANECKTEAPSNKASQLNAGVSWLFSGGTETLPESLRSAAEEVRAALRDGDVREVEIWYVHNLPESANVRRELSQATETADSIIRREFPDARVDVSAIEIGRTILEEEYARIQAPILVSETVRFDIPGGFETSAEGWRAFSTAIKASDLRGLWATHQARLMSPNIRDYLGIVRSAGNINFGIKQTAKDEPQNFAIYNNGITVLVHDYRLVDQEGERGPILEVDGVGIVNGGQTTGALGGLADKEVENIGQALVMARFVKCSDTDVLGNIVKFNNTQNKIEATDFRSNDHIQDRLRKEFALVPDADYRGGRRGGVSDAIARSRSLLPDSSVAQSLAAFHGDPNLAYNELRNIWDQDLTYSMVFRETVNARHIVFTYGLLKAVERAKHGLMKIDDGSRTEAQKKHANFFSSRGSNLLLVAAIGACIETILGRAVADRYSLKFSENLSPSTAVDVWQPVVDIVVAFSNQLQPATDQGLKSQERVAKGLTDFGAMIEAVRSANPGSFDALATAARPAGGGARVLSAPPSEGK